MELMVVDDSSSAAFLLGCHGIDAWDARRDSIVRFGLNSSSWHFDDSLMPCRPRRSVRLSRLFDVRWAVTAVKSKLSAVTVQCDSVSIFRHGALMIRWSRDDPDNLLYSRW